jgi:hypothetical protein
MRSQNSLINAKLNPSSPSDFDPSPSLTTLSISSNNKGAVRKIESALDMKVHIGPLVSDETQERRFELCFSF